MADDVVYKNTLDTKDYTVDFTALLVDDTTIHTTNSVVVVTNSAGTVITTVNGTLVFSGMTMKIPLTAGVDGEDYKIIAKGIGVTTSKPRTFVLELRVRDSLSGAV